MHDAPCMEKTPYADFPALPSASAPIPPGTDALVRAAELDASLCASLRDKCLETRLNVSGEDARADLWKAAAACESAARRSAAAARKAQKGAR